MPFNFMVGKLLTKSIVVSLEIGNPIIYDDGVYACKLEARVACFF